jgi:hypothetical protein
VDLLIKIVCFVENKYKAFSMKRSPAELDDARRFIVLILTLQLGFPGKEIKLDERI